MKRVLLVLALIASSSVFAQKGAKINSQLALESMPEAKDVQEAIQKKAAELEQLLMLQGQKAQRAVAIFDSLSQLPDASPFDISSARDDAEYESQKYQKKQATAQQELQAFQQARMQPLQEKLQDVVKAICTDKSIDYVLDVSYLVYASDTMIDITDEVITKIGGSPTGGQ